MKIYNLTYRLRFTDKEVVMLSEIANDLSCELERIKRDTTVTDFAIIFYLNNCLRDLREIIVNKNVKGLAYNSLVINLICYKLSFSVDLLLAKEGTAHTLYVAHINLLLGYLCNLERVTKARCYKD